MGFLLEGAAFDADWCRGQGQLKTNRPNSSPSLQPSSTSKQALQNPRHFRSGLYRRRWTRLRAHERETYAQDSIRRQEAEGHRTDRRAYQHHQIQQIRHSYRLDRFSLANSARMPAWSIPAQPKKRLCDLRRKTRRVDPYFY
jgi:hypothetical protein